MRTGESEGAVCLSSVIHSFIPEIVSGGRMDINAYCLLSVCQI